VIFLLVYLLSINNFVTKFLNHIQKKVSLKIQLHNFIVDVFNHSNLNNLPIIFNYVSLLKIENIF